MKRRYSNKRKALIQKNLALAKDFAIKRHNKNTPNRRDEPHIINPIEKNVRGMKRKDIEDALAWFFREVKGQLGPRNIPKTAFNPQKDAFIGGVFFYYYDAKLKDKLPYWDQFPLVIPINIYSDGFLGLNLHYLPPEGRAKLLDVLLKFKRRALTPKAYMQLSYDILKRSVNHALFMPCIHRYLTNHIISPLVRVDDEHWEKVAALPVQQFVGAGTATVWKDSKRKMGGTKTTKTRSGRKR